MAKEVVDAPTVAPGDFGARGAEVAQLTKLEITPSGAEQTDTTLGKGRGD